MKYRCKKPLLLQAFDEDGFEIENKYLEVKEGATWVKHVSEWRLADVEVRLLLDPVTEKDEVTWIEITAEHLAEHFEIVE